VSEFLEMINVQRESLGRGRLRLVNVDYHNVVDSTNPGAESFMFVDNQTVTVVCRWWRAKLALESRAICERAQAVSCVFPSEAVDGLARRRAIQQLMEVVPAMGTPTRSGLKSTFALPIPADCIFVLYLKQISMQRDLKGQAPVVLDKDGKRLVFVDLAGPGLSKAVDDGDVESVWTWCVDWAARQPVLPPRPRSSLEQCARRHYERALKDCPELGRFVQVKQASMGANRTRRSEGAPRTR